MERKRVAHKHLRATTFWCVLGLHTDLTLNDLKGVSLVLSSTCVHSPWQHVERWTCQPNYRKRLLSTWAIYCEERPLSHQKPSSCPERQWGCRGHFSRTETCQLKIYSAGVMEKALIQFALINLKQRLMNRGEKIEKQVRAAHIHKCSSQYTRGHASVKSTISFGHPVRVGHVYATVVSERDEHIGLDSGFLHGLSGWCMAPGGALSPGSNQSWRLPA